MTTSGDPRTATAFDARRVRADVPALAGSDRSYLDSASTTQVPAPVLDAVDAVLRSPAANPGRGSYPWATAAVSRVEAVRSRVARFVGARHAAEVALLPGATLAAHAVAAAWGATALDDGDEVLVCPGDHASTVLPWVRLRDALAATGRRVRLVPYRRTATGEVDVADVRARLGPRTRVVVLTHLHGVNGARSTLEELDGAVPRRVVRVVDATQSAGRVAVDVDALGADFLFLSGHKTFGLPGAAALYCRPRTHDAIGPFLPGGGSAPTGDGLDGLDLPGGPGGLESGSPDLPALVALGAALDHVDRLGVDAVGDWNRELTGRLVDGLRALPGVRLLPGVAHAGCRVGYGIVPFAVDGERSDDVAFALAEHGVDVRAGDLCLATRGASGDAVRASTHAYTTTDDVDRLLSALRDLVGGGPTRA